VAAPFLTDLTLDPLDATTGKFGLREPTDKERLASVNRVGHAFGHKVTWSPDIAPEGRFGKKWDSSTV
jgi:hypothetical protein